MQTARTSRFEIVEWTTTGRLVTFQLAPGEFVEVNATGIGIGASKNAEDWQDARVGSWVEAKEGDDVTLATAPVPLDDWNENPPSGGEPRLVARFHRCATRAAICRCPPSPPNARACSTAPRLKFSAPVD